MIGTWEEAQSEGDKCGYTLDTNTREHKHTHISDDATNRYNLENVCTYSTYISAGKRRCLFLFISIKQHLLPYLLCFFFAICRQTLVFPKNANYVWKCSTFSLELTSNNIRIVCHTFHIRFVKRFFLPIPTTSHWNNKIFNILLPIWIWAKVSNSSLFFCNFSSFR